LGLFNKQKKKEPDFSGKFKLPEKSNASGELPDEPEALKPVLGASTQEKEQVLPPEIKEESTKIEDEKALFEVPDFSENDLNFDLPTDSEFRKNKTEPEIPVEDDDKLPKFSTGRTIDSDSLEEEISKREYPNTNKENKEELLSFNKEPAKIPRREKIEVFIEKNHYLNTLSREEEVTNSVKQIKQDLASISRFASKEDKMYEEIVKEAEILKDKLLALESRIFEQR